MKVFSSLLGIPGWRPPWSITMPLTNLWCGGVWCSGEVVVWCGVVRWWCGAVVGWCSGEVVVWCSSWMVEW